MYLFETVQSSSREAHDPVASYSANTFRSSSSPPAASAGRALRVAPVALLPSSAAAAALAAARARGVEQRRRRRRRARERGGAGAERERAARSARRGVAERSAPAIAHALRSAGSAPYAEEIPSESSGMAHTVVSQILAADPRVLARLEKWRAPPMEKSGCSGCRYPGRYGRVRAAAAGAPSSPSAATQRAGAARRRRAAPLATRYAGRGRGAACDAARAPGAAPRGCRAPTRRRRQRSVEQVDALRRRACAEVSSMARGARRRRRRRHGDARGRGAQARRAASRTSTRRACPLSTTRARPRRSGARRRKVKRLRRLVERRGGCGRSTLAAAGLGRVGRERRCRGATTPRTAALRARGAARACSCSAATPRAARAAARSPPRFGPLNAPDGAPGRDSPARCVGGQARALALLVRRARARRRRRLFCLAGSRGAPPPRAGARRSTRTVSLRDAGAPLALRGASDVPRRRLDRAARREPARARVARRRRRASASARGRAPRLARRAQPSLPKRRGVGCRERLRERPTRLPRAAASAPPIADDFAARPPRAVRARARARLVEAISCACARAARARARAL